MPIAEIWQSFISDIWKWLFINWGTSWLALHVYYFLLKPNLGDEWNNDTREIIDPFKILKYLFFGFGWIGAGCWVIMLVFAGFMIIFNILSDAFRSPKESW